MTGGNASLGPGLLQYTTEPAVEHIAWEETDDGLKLTLLPLPVSVWRVVLQIVLSIAAILWLIRVDFSLRQWLPFLLLYAVLLTDQFLRFRRSRRPLFIRVSITEHRLTMTGGELPDAHSWIVGQIHEIRAPISGFKWSGQVLSAIEITPVTGARIRVGTGRRMEEMDWAVKKLRRAMTAAGWEGARRKSRARRIGEWLGRCWRGSPEQRVQ